ncbi:peptidoglycan-binding domain-containing protein [Neotabrizicola sp. VNH66]|uniref:peptidoglycan-binding domain-containing protein n=1 Tax=Neotabrizicola sp. VNH66 TaxID=3400918 RepID=UPI003BFFE4F0
MKSKAFATSAATTVLVASLSFAPVPVIVAPAHADTGDVVAGLIIGGIVGAAINEGSKKKAPAKAKSKSTKSKSSGLTAEQKAANIEVQSALNYFGWNVGTADGVLGNKSKSAIRDYQAFLGEGITGDLTADQRSILVTAHARGMAGGAVIQNIVASSMHGTRGILLAQRDEMRAASGAGLAAGAPAAAAPGSVAAAAAAAIPVLLPEPATPAPAAPITPAPEVVAVPVPAPAEAPVATAAAEPALPSFMGANGAKGTLSAECNAVTLAASAKGGYVTAATMTDANAALAEQFCLTRAASIATGHELTAKVAGFTPDQIAAQCASFGPMMKDQVAALSLRPADEVLAGVEGFILNSGMSPAQLSGTAKVCLGVGYERDQMDVAIGSALLLAAMGETGYAELLGHHLSQGFGATARKDLAVEWYEIALPALSGGTDVFAPGMTGRNELVKKAAYTIAGRAWELAPQPAVQEAALPVFEVPAETPATAVAAAPEPAPVVPVPAPAAAAPVADPAPVAVAAVPAAPAPAPTEASAALETAPAVPSPTGEVMRAGAEAVAVAASLPFFLFAAN